MNEVIEILKKLGLTTTEIKLYLYGLQFKSIGVAKLVSLSGTKRTTAYHALETLLDKGLVTRSRQDGKLTYQMQSPDKLKDQLNTTKLQISQKILDLESVIDKFPKPLSVDTELPSVVNYYGHKGVQDAIKQALYCQSREWLVVAPYENYIRFSPESFKQTYKNIRAERGIISKTLWEHESKKIIKNFDIIKYRNPRYLPKKMSGHFKAMQIIYDDKILNISSHKEQSATLISSKQIANLQRVMFMALWDASEEPIISQ